jgi:shikimate dehydrogenase
VNPTPLLAVVLGKPVSHSLSPAMYRAVFEAHDINGAYEALECDEDHVMQLVTDLQARGVRGLSVTMPLKEKIVAVLDEIDDVAAVLNAVNCVVLTSSHSVGHNTDGDGCCDALTQQGGAQLEGATAVILGAGGTGRSVALALGRRGAHVVVVNRSVDHAEYLVKSLNEIVMSCGGSLRIGEMDDVATADVVVNTTPVGMNSSESLVPASLFHSQQVVLDAVYQPLETIFLADARAAGATVVDGLWMLVQQARRQCVLQFGQLPSGEVMRQAAERELQARRL